MSRLASGTAGPWQSVSLWTGCRVWLYIAEGITVKCEQCGNTVERPNGAGLCLDCQIKIQQLIALNPVAKYSLLPGLVWKQNERGEWIRNLHVRSRWDAPEASQSDPARKTVNPSDPSGGSTPEADPVPVEVISAAYALRAQGKPVSVRAACKKSGRDRKHFTQTYPEAVKMVEMMAAPGRQPIRGSKVNGNLEACEDDD